MAIKITNITNEPNQRHKISFGESEIVLKLRFLSMPRCWVFSVEYKNFKRSNVCLSLGVTHMVSANQPFDFVITDTSSKGVDPCLLDDFSSGRVELYMLEPIDMIKVRGGVKVVV